MLTTVTHTSHLQDSGKHKMAAFQVNQLVRWTTCPPSIAPFAESRILEISACGEFVRIGFIHHWVKISEIEPSECSSAAKFWKLYPSH